MRSDDEDGKPRRGSEADESHYRRRDDRDGASARGDVLPLLTALILLTAHVNLPEHLPYVLILALVAFCLPTPPDSPPRSRRRDDNDDYRGGGGGRGGGGKGGWDGGDYFGGKGGWDGGKGGGWGGKGFDGGKGYGGKGWWDGGKGGYGGGGGWDGGYGHQNFGGKGGGWSAAKGGGTAWGAWGPGWGGGGWEGGKGGGWGGSKGWDGGGGKGFWGGKGGGRGGKGGGGSAPEHDYKRMEGDVAPVDVAAVNGLLSQRVGAKRAGDFHRADRIRNELRALGVAVLDREREWHVIIDDGLGRPDGGGEGPYGGYGGAHNMSERFGETGHDYRRGDDGTLECDEPKVNELLAARLHARLNRDFVAADRMRDTLRREHGVECFDQEREWRCLHPPGSEQRNMEGKLDLRTMQGLMGGGEPRGRDAQGGVEEGHDNRRRRVSGGYEEDEEA